MILATGTRDDRLGQYGRAQRALRMTHSVAAGEVTFTLGPVPSLETLEAEWRRFDRAGRHSFFLTWTWIGTWLKCLPPNLAPMLLKATRGGEVVGLALLTLRHGTIKGIMPVRQAWLNCTGDPALDCITIEHNGFASVLADDEELWSALAGLFASGSFPADELVLSGISPRWLANAEKGLIQVERREPAYRTPLCGITVEEGIEPLLSRNSRQQLRRSMRDYERDAPLAIDVARDPGTAFEYFAQMKDLHVRSWTRRGRRHAFASPFFETFHRALIKAGIEEGVVDLMRVTCGSRVLGYLYNFRRNGKVFSYQSGFDDAELTMRPGYVCHAIAISYYAAAGMSHYDFLAEANRLKQSFGTESYELSWSRVRRSTPKFRAEALVRRAVRLFTRHDVGSRLNGNT
jgi:CelD/BcsL family acetyltransferase involved in cellulose biosynthesis